LAMPKEEPILESEVKLEAKKEEEKRDVDRTAAIREISEYLKAEWKYDRDTLDFTQVFDPRIINNNRSN